IAKAVNIESDSTAANGQEAGDPSIALRAFHAAFEPGDGIDVSRRIHAGGRVAHDVDHLWPTFRLVKFVGSDRGVADTLMAVGESHLHDRARRRKRNPLERRDHFLGTRPSAALLRLRL